MTGQKNILSPSLLSIDYCNIERDVNVLNEAGVAWFHLDIMDGYFVPNISFGPDVIRAIRKKTDAFFDVHLMITEPVRYIENFKSAGADMLTVHIEACEDVKKTLEAIKDAGLKCGLAVNPETDIQLVKPYISMVDMILVMSVHPGFGGQKFILDALDKVSAVAQMAKDAERTDLLIQVDGGINVTNVTDVLKAGANVIVAGSAVFKDDIRKNVETFDSLLKEA